MINLGVKQTIGTKPDGSDYHIASRSHLEKTAKRSLLQRLMISLLSPVAFTNDILKRTKDLPSRARLQLESYARQMYSVSVITDSSLTGRCAEYHLSDDGI